MVKEMQRHKSLCVCAGGRVRSVAARFVLIDHYGHDALACGIEKNTTQTIGMLIDWADTVWVLDSALLQFVYDLAEAAAVRGHLAKIKLIDVGPDTWGSETNKTLRLYVASKIEKHLGEPVK